MSEWSLDSVSLADGHARRRGHLRQVFSLLGMQFAELPDAVHKLCEFFLGSVVLSDADLFDERVVKGNGFGAHLIGLQSRSRVDLARSGRNLASHADLGHQRLRVGFGELLVATKLFVHSVKKR